MLVLRRLARRSACAVLVAAALLSAGPADAGAPGGARVCDGPYALCSSATCQPIAGHPNHVTCACEGPLNGLNIGNSSCFDRTKGPTSTFSLWDLTATADKPAKRSLACAGENAGRWAFCLDAPCTMENGSLSCTCKLHKKPRPFVAFVDQCPADRAALHRACAQIWSSATKKQLNSGYSQLAAYYGTPPDITLCPALAPKK